MLDSWLIAILFVGSLTYTTVSLVRRANAALDTRRRNQAHRRRYW